MPAAASELIDMRAYVAELRRERYRSFLLHAPPLAGKSAFARDLAAATAGAYLDVLATVAGAPRLAEKVDTLGPDLLKEMALEAAVAGRRLVLVDEFDFLVPIWGGSLSALIEMVRKLSVTETPAVVGFVMQTVPAVEQLQMATTAGRSRVLRLEDIRAL